MARLLVTLVAIASVSSAAGEFAVFDNRTRHAVPTYKLNLDLPQKSRWSHIIKDFKSFAPQILAYLESNIPKWAIPIIKTIAKDIRPYFTDYGDEMLGIAEAFDLDVGYVTALNLVYQLESLGLNCSNWNNTGPTRKDDPGCMKIDPKQDWCYCHDKKEQPYIDPMTGILQPPKFRAANLSAAATPTVRGMCTSVVAQGTDGHVIHGRNLDWNIPRILREMVIDIEFQRGNRTIFTGTGIAGFVGVFNGQIAGPNGWSVSMDARGKGGKVFKNLLQALLHKSMTPAQHLRKTLESGCDYETAVDSPNRGLRGVPLIDEAYFIVAGAAPWKGGVMTMDRNSVVDFWGLDQSSSTGWFRLETNYDHWSPVPKADDRRTPGYAHMQALGESGVDHDGLLKVMKQWPTYNDHTDYTAIMEPASGFYDSGVWL